MTARKLLIAIGVGVGAYLIFRRTGSVSLPAGNAEAAGASASAHGVVQPSVPPAPTPSLGLTAEAAASSATHLPLQQIGDTAEAAPAWVKVAVLPVGVTALTQATIEHPIRTAQSAARTVSHVVGSAYHFVAGLV